MSKQTVSLADGVDLIIDEPPGTSSSDRAAMVASAVINEFGNGSGIVVLPLNKRGEFEFKIGYSIFKIYYQYKANRVISALEAYSAAIRYIENNIYQFDYGLAQKAIEVLRKCYKDELR